MTTGWRAAQIGPGATITQAVQAIEAGVLQIALVVDAEGRLLGTVTDGDVRRGILRGLTLGAPVTAIMNGSPTVGSAEAERASRLALLRRKQLHQLPLVDVEGRVVGVDTLDALLSAPVRTENVLIMAGGVGSRLAPLTDACPKPMLHVGGRPLLETTLMLLREAGFRVVHIAVNHLAHVIMDHFGDGSAWGLELRYVQERERLGTAGALALLPEPGDAPWLVMNGDLLVKIDHDRLFATHARHASAATMCIREHTIQVPYGVVTIDGHRLVGIDEKPSHRFFVSAGIYVLSPEAIARVPHGVPSTMPELFECLMAEGRVTTVHQLRDYWLDIGQMADFERANWEFAEVFP